LALEPAAFEGALGAPADVFSFMVWTSFFAAVEKREQGLHNSGMITFFRKCLPAILLILTVANASTALAQEDAFSIEVAVADRSDGEQQNAYRAAMRQALLDNGRNKRILNRGDVRRELAKAEDYVESFSYRTPEPGSVISRETPITDTVRKNGQATQLMLVRFNRSKLIELIDRNPNSRQANTGNSGENDGAAPPDAFANVGRAILWMLIQDDKRNIRISDTAASNVRTRARELAGAASVSVTYPFGDDEDRASVPQEVLEALDTDNLRLGSQRYQHDAILAATLSRNTGGGWQGRWTRIADDQADTREFTSRSLDLALQEGIGFLTSSNGIDTSYRYGGDGTSETEALVYVSSVRSTAHYASMLKFLSSLPSVSTVYPKEINGDAMVFAVLPRSALQEIDFASRSQNWLQRTAAPADSESMALARNADLALDILR